MDKNDVVKNIMAGTYATGRGMMALRKDLKSIAYDLGGSAMGGARLRHANLNGIRMKGNRIVDFQEKPESPKSTLISTGIYVFPGKTLAKYKEYLADKNNPDAPGYFLQWLIKRTELEAVVYKGKWFDVGTIETYKKVFDMHL